MSESEMIKCSKKCGDTTKKIMILMNKAVWGPESQESKVQTWKRGVPCNIKTSTCRGDYINQ